ncbi:MAG TPA: hypothetical protein RMH99_13330 [Sandaracinaceae bacterium LLY-WYZ-13_1]|nr:hypothetical protein [Sandaracinaceae bacterium LLY-WYZ-13_1]
MSYDAIGWAVCHYGEWVVLDDGRWAWVPGTEWAPAWVDWRRSERYVGWAPRVRGDVDVAERWVFVEVAALLVDFVGAAMLPPPRVPGVLADRAPRAARRPAGAPVPPGRARVAAPACAVPAHRRRAPPAGDGAQELHDRAPRRAHRASGVTARAAAK